MILEVTKLHLYKKSQIEGTYLMIEMLDIETKKWYRTYLCPNYRNFNRWRRIAKIGNIINLKNLKMKTEDIIDADSYPQLAGGKLVGSGSRKKFKKEMMDKYYKKNREELLEKIKKLNPKIKEGYELSFIPGTPFNIGTGEALEKAIKIVNKNLKR